MRQLGLGFGVFRASEGLQKSGFRLFRGIYGCLCPCRFDIFGGLEIWVAGFCKAALRSQEEYSPP